MSDKLPEIYGYCPAGCKYPTVHREEFEKSAAYIKMYPTVDNGDMNNKYALEERKTYKIYYLDNSHEYQEGYGRIVIGYVESGKVGVSYAYIDPTVDKYNRSWNFKLLSRYNDSDKYYIVYEENGTRKTFEIEISASNLGHIDEIYISNASKVLLVNEDAEMTAVGSGGTTVTVGGVAQDTWDADTKVDKVTEATQFHQLYGKTNAGVQKMYNVSHYNYTGNVPVYEKATQTIVGSQDDGGTIAVSIPLNPYQATPKKYVDTGLDGKVSKYTGTADTYSKIYGQEANTGNEKVFNASGSPVYNDVVMYAYTSEGGYNSAGEWVNYQSGAVSTGIPLQPAHATPKKWVEDNFTVYKHLIQLNMGEGGIPHVFNVLSTRSTPYTNASELPKNEIFTIVDDTFEQIQFVKIDSGDNVYGIQYDYYAEAWSYISSTISSFFGIDSDTVIKA